MEINNFSEDFNRYCVDFGIDLRGETKNTLRVKLEDLIDNYQDEIWNEWVGMDLRNEKNFLIIPMNLNNNIFKLKALYNECMQLFYKQK